MAAIREPLRNGYIVRALEDLEEVDGVRLPRRRDWQHGTGGLCP